eukprot:TRINITY_DN8066_c0_g3_i1.p1 TRINITY_DN8066_c0_g3~~TRINITY_DN8066_c0_g3_i1.p1  ORF type:complete len:207 (-),score=26.09 TRINITY_DN8066_c0_g3_i1:99-719(-)
MARSLVSASLLLLIDATKAATLRGTSPAVDIAQVMQKLPLLAVSDDSGMFENATTFLQELKDKQGPQSPYKHALEDPQLAIGFSSCPRDTTGCPEGFVAADVSAHVCVPRSSYRGPCASPIDLTSMTTSAKARWSKACQAAWPCSACVRDYSACPAGWTRTAVSNALRCEPSAAYMGACDATDFVGGAVASLESWASSCGAVWPCM